jgi:hypothetical protein
VRQQPEKQPAKQPVKPPKKDGKIDPTETMKPFGTDQP